MAIVLAVDMMGGDGGLDVTVAGCLQFLEDYADVHLLCVGDSEQIKSKIATSKLSRHQQRIEVVHASQVVTMNETAQSAMRNKKDSSMRVAINMVKDKRSSAIISSGNTGALMATARYVLRTMENIDRPAIAKILPTIKNDVCILDLGANVECEPEHLLQFAIMGTQIMRASSKSSPPSVGLLNIGSEDIKGHDGIKKAAELLKASGLNFYGNVEGDDINKGTVDVVVCDGFTGNVALKTLEGVAKMIAFFIREEFNKSILFKLMGLIAYPVIRRIRSRADPRKYNGAILIGLNGVVIKSHGGTDAFGFYYALKQAYIEVTNGVIEQLDAYLKDHQKNIIDNIDKLNGSAGNEFDYLNML